jgi:methyltransferase
MGLQRLRELALSRQLSRELVGETAAAGSFPLMVATHVGLFLLPPIEVRVTRCRPRTPLVWVFLLVGATGLRWWSIRTLGPDWNVRALVPAGLRPVATGPYRWIRHPNYLAVIIEFAALPMGAGAWRSAAGLSLLNAAVLRERIGAEEALLSKVPGYDELFSAKARFIPHIV